MKFEDYKTTIPEAKFGKWEIQRFEVDEGSLTNYRLILDGRGATKGTYTRLVRDSQTVVMSDTPAEIGDCLGFIRMANGRVLINGLGLGIVATALMAKKSVDHIDIVEIDGDLINHVGDYLSTLVGAEKLVFHHDNAIEKKWPKNTTWDYAWHDIWDDIITDNLETMSMLHRKYGRRAKQQDSWLRDRLTYLRRQEKKQERIWEGW